MSNPTIPQPKAAQTNLHPFFQSNGHLPSTSSAIQLRQLPLPFQRADIHAIKQELHDALAENGLGYWKALNGYLIGQIGRAELESMVRKWLKKGNAHLHNRLLVSLLHNASAPPTQSILSPNTAQRKRRRLDYDDPEFDVDDTHVEPRNRVQGWMSGISARDIARIRKVMIKPEEDTEEVVNGGEDDGFLRQRQTIPSNSLPPLASTSRYLPSAHQLSSRLSQYAKSQSLNLNPETIPETSEFLALALDAHLSDVMHALVHLTGTSRTGSDSMHPPHQTDPHLPKPDLSTMRGLFDIQPGLHPQNSAVVYKLATAEGDQGEGDKVRGQGQGKKRRVGEVDERRTEEITARLVEGNMLKLDKAGKDGEGEGTKREKKHGLHWKYEDPAMIFKDILG